MFKNIEDAYEGKPSLFDDITQDDLIMAFFPCIKFCQMSDYNQRSTYERWKKQGMKKQKIWEHLKKESDERYIFYQICLKMHAVIDTLNLRLIMENPWSIFNYTNYLCKILDKLSKKPVFFGFTFSKSVATERFFFPIK